MPRRRAKTPAVLTLAEAELWHIRTVVKAVGGNHSVAAKLLDIDRRTLQRVLRKRRRIATMKSSDVPAVGDLAVVLVRLAARTYEARARRGWSLQEAARQCGLALRTYQRVEDATGSDVPISVVQKLARGLGLTISDLLATPPRRSPQP
ncbi:MAG: helix-turn-helix domain-containing protein [Deltaproteobacteria bacterium]|nr:helix-turn-helix domain-containing protein [Deltaproteobacteria bacterium]